MTDKEIIKALEICNSLSLRCGNGCPYYTVPYKNGKRCSEMMIDDALDLINRLKAQSNGYRNKAQTQKGELARLYKQVAEQKAEIERLKPFEKKVLEPVVDNLEENVRLEKENFDLKKVIETMTNEQIQWGFEMKNKIEQSKAEAIKEFADAIKEKYKHSFFTTEDLDNLVKEMVGE